ncbi:Xanthine/uracil permease family protein [Actinidia rufa]|uniref:Xanthine/uracil permease family protein n=1 Tax=Actinidia rufa TaxID=165716 RepID=A0A7J0ENT4_9ERIC|nr:Xanthine/uracil permease family protein [Actinidia rufa]
MGAPTFDTGEGFAMMVASFVALVESGAFISVSSYASSTLPPSILSHSVGRAEFSSRVIDDSFSMDHLTGKFGAVFASIPAPIVMSLCYLFFVYIGAGGLNFLQFCNLISFRTKFILGFSIFMGISTRPQQSMVMVPYRVEQVGTSPGCDLALKDSTTTRNRGMHWWDSFRSIKMDTKFILNEEFCSLIHTSSFSVPCLRRAESAEEEYEAAGGEALLDNDGWLGTHGKPKSFSSYFGGEEEEDIPDMAEYGEPDNGIGTDPSFHRPKSSPRKQEGVASNFTSREVETLT